MMVGTPTIAETSARFVATLEPEERNAVQLELSRFVRWFGPDQPIDGMDARTLETYQEQVVKSGANQNRRLEPVRALLTYAQRQGFLTSNFAKYIKLKRASSRKQGRGGAIFSEEGSQITAEGFAKLKEELDRLITVERPKVTQELWEARLDKDIRENAPYDAAKQHQALVEARIRELEQIVATARVVVGNQSGGRVSVGTKIVLRDLSYDEELSYTLVGPQEANPRAGKISMASPVGKALLEKTEGEVIEVEAPAGTIRYRIEKIER